MSTPRPRKLLLRTLRAQLAYAGLVLVAGTFLFYYVLRQLYFTDVDEALVLRREEVVKKLPLVPAPADLALWMRLDRDLPTRQDPGTFYDQLESVPVVLERLGESR